MWNILETLRPYSTLVSVVLASFLTCLVYDLIAQRSRAKQTRVTMTKGERDKVVREIVSDGICDLLENLHYKDKISREERDLFYFMIGNRCGLPDLVPMYVIKHPNPEDLKNKILKRLNGNSSIQVRLRSIFNRRST